MITPRPVAWRAALFLSCLGGCSDGDVGARLASALGRTETEPVIITLGGYNSCVASPDGPTPAGSDRWNRAAALTARFTHGAPRWLHACCDASSHLYWLSSSSPTRVVGTTLDALAPFIAAVTAVTRGERHPVYIQGHSYGGWLAMQTARALPASIDLRMLVTVDPISPMHCTVASYLRAVALPATAPWSLAGCQRAPADITPDARRAIVDRLPDGAWRHYYQRNFLPLRSSAFEGPPLPHHSYDLSAFLTHLGGARPSWNAHVGINELSVVWYTFEASIARDLEAF